MAFSGLITAADGCDLVRHTGALLRGCYHVVPIGDLSAADGCDLVRNTGALSRDCYHVVLIGHLSAADECDLVGTCLYRHGTNDRGAVPPKPFL